VLLVIQWTARPDLHVIENQYSDSLQLCLTLMEFLEANFFGLFAGEVHELSVGLMKLWHVLLS
jgi:hypothetical protein